MAAVDELPYEFCTALGFRVLVKLANVAAPDGTRAFRSKTDMARELGVSPRSIQRALVELQECNLIRKGDQRHVTHIVANRRPTVYDLNMRHPNSVQVPLPETDGPGETEISTADLGETAGETTAGAHKELDEQLNTSTPGNYRAPVSPASLRCSAPGQQTHRFDPLSGWCPCGVRSDALEGAHA